MSIGLDRSKVILVEHNPAWAEMYNAEAGYLKELLGGEILFIDHVGSTSVTGIKAKPVIDILVQIPTKFISEEGEQKFLTNGYKKTTFERRIEPMYSKTLEANIATHNVHITQARSILANALLNFRNALRADIVLAKKYEQLKLDLAASFGDDRKAYYDAKIDFFESVVGKYFDPPKVKNDSNGDDG